MKLRTKLLTKALSGLSVALLTVSAHAVMIGTDYVGSIDPNTPSSGPNEIGYINHLITVPTGGTDSEDTSPPPGATREYDRTGSDLGNSLPEATGGVQGLDPADTVDASGYQYLLGKYGTVAHVWYSPTGFSSSESVPSSAPGGGLSHISLYNATPTDVPDGGTTVTLLGLSLLGVAFGRRFKRA